jgi:hypothetical protein
MTVPDNNVRVGFFKPLSLMDDPSHPRAINGGGKNPVRFSSFHETKEMF